MRIDSLYMEGKMLKNISPDSVRSGRTCPANLDVRSCPVRKLICPVRSSPTLRLCDSSCLCGKFVADRWCCGQRLTCLRGNRGIYRKPHGGIPIVHTTPPNSQQAQQATSHSFWKLFLTNCINGRERDKNKVEIGEQNVATFSRALGFIGFVLFAGC